MPRHWLAGRITDDCPRCGWHGHFHHHLATVDGDWAEISRAEAEQITAGLAARNWPPDAAGLPWVESAYPR